MSHAIRELLDVFNGGEPSPALAHLIMTLGHEDVRILSMKLFGWLKSQKRFRHERPLEYRGEYHWCRDLVTAMQEWDDLGELFVMAAEGLVFTMALSAAERDTIRDLVDREYDPLHPCDANG